MTKPYSLHLGDCLESLRAMPDNSVDSIVTDPPYGLTQANRRKPAPHVEGSPFSRHRVGVNGDTKPVGGFMGHEWDSDVPSEAIWRECLRVLKPGGHLLAFAGTRTQHRMAVRIEDAGFEIRDMIAWVYGSGFPKSRNIAEMDMTGEDSERWAGWGTALKPALEPITVARKPLVGTVAANVLAHGTGALNIDGCRVPTDDKLGGGAEKATTVDQKGNEGWTRPWMEDEAARESHAARVRSNVERAEAMGRWPANLIHDGSEDGTAPLGDAARFFYCAKASRKDRNEGLPDGGGPAVGTGATMREREDADWPARNGNHHPTVKPTDLMRYLCRLVTPPGGVVLDPFMGSGSTGKAAMLEGFRFVGCELSEDYLAIARARIESAWKSMQPKPEPEAPAAPQGDLFAA